MTDIQRFCYELTDGDRTTVYHAQQGLAIYAGKYGRKLSRVERAKMAAELAEFIDKGLGDRDKASYRNVGLRAPEAQRDTAAVNYVLRMLALVGDDKQVPAIAQQFDNFYTRDMAAWCLTRMKGKAATAALAKAATDSLGTEFRIGAINGLAAKQGDNAVAALQTCLKDPEIEIRLAAAEALASHPVAEHDKLIAASGRGGNPRAASRVARARLRLAENLLSDGQKDAARRILHELSESRTDSPQKTSATDVLIHLG